MEHAIETPVTDDARAALLQRLMSVAAQVLDCRYSAFTVMHGGAVQVIAGHRIASGSFHLRHSPCARVCSDDRPLLVPDLAAHPDYRDHPWALCLPKLRFYAAVPVRTAGGYCIGSLCVMDPAEPREPADWHRRLADCATLLAGLIEAFSAPVALPEEESATSDYEHEITGRALTRLPGDATLLH